MFKVAGLKDTYVTKYQSLYDVAVREQIEKEVTDIWLNDIAPLKSKVEKRKRAIYWSMKLMDLYDGYYFRVNELDGYKIRFRKGTDKDCF